MTTAANYATREVSWCPSFYRGEQYDSDLGLYYLRARYYNPSTGRFMSRDPESGVSFVPKTLHKYLYANGDPVNLKDPSGKGAIGEFFFLLATNFRLQVTVVVSLALVGEATAGVFECLADELEHIKDMNEWSEQGIRGNPPPSKICGIPDDEPEDNE